MAYDKLVTGLIAAASGALVCWLPSFLLTYTVEPPLTATSLQQPFFFWGTVHTFTLVSTSLQWPLSSVPKVAVVERFNCIVKRTRLLSSDLVHARFALCYCCLRFWETTNLLLPKLSVNTIIVSVRTKSWIKGGAGGLFPRFLYWSEIPSRLLLSLWCRSMRRRGQSWKLSTVAWEVLVQQLQHWHPVLKILSRPEVMAVVGAWVPPEILNLLLVSKFAGFVLSLSFSTWLKWFRRLRRGCECVQ